MKSRKSVFRAMLLAFLVFLAGCGESLLEPEVYSETAAANTFQSLQGIEAVLYGAHANLAMMGGNDAAQQISAEVIMTDIGFVTAGAIANWATNFQDWVLDGVGSSMYSTMWEDPYQAIRNANIILENLDSAPISESEKTVIRAEARFIRAVSYWVLYKYFGPVPLRIGSDQELELPRATEQEILDFMETELLAAIEGLPAKGQEKAYGRAHKEAAMGYLTKIYLNTKQWQKTADMAQQIIASGKFQLFSDYFGLFQVKNEGNSEIIWARTAKADLGREANISFMNFAWPTAFKLHPRTGLTFCDGCRNFATMARIRDDFWHSFEEGDQRTSLMLEEYVNESDELIDLRPPNDNVRPFKYWPADDFAGPAYGNDVPVIRYADILLSRAEALNELQGPNQEAIDLINQVRNRAGVGDLELTEVPSKESLRDHILQERGWEFWWEGKRREDLIRHGKFIEQAQARGLPAQSHHVRHPIPLFALDANPALEQNPGY